VIAGNLGYYFHETARAAPGRLAVLDLWGGTERRVSYGALDARLDRFAAATKALGLSPGDKLFICIGNRVEFLEVFFGAMRAGVVPVPGNPRSGLETLSYVIADSGARAAVVDPAANAHAASAVERAGLAPRLSLAKRAGWDDYDSALDAAPASFAPPRLAPDHPCFLPYTSGSTGKPKGVVLTHAGQVWWLGCRHRLYPVDPSTLSLVAAPVFHKNAMGAAIKPNLLAGASLIFLPRFEPRAYLEALARYRCTHATGVPTMFILLLQERDLIARLDLSAWKTVMIGSAPVHEELVTAMERTFGVRVIQGYGLTEGGPVMFGPPTDGRAVPVGSVGVPWPEGEVRLVGVNGRDGDYGELWVRNPGVTPGYHGLPDVTAERIAGGFLKTGDLFSRDGGGFYFFRGRVDDMFTCGGENIYPKEVENLLMAHPDVTEACVIAMPHETKGMAPWAIVVRARGGTADEEALKRHCLDHGPAYAHPRRVVFTDELPQTGAGKVDRAAVKAALEARPR
jgi:long-chain acyl-CoA synthetase